jgi:hypothetical protein
VASAFAFHAYSILRPAVKLRHGRGDLPLQRAQSILKDRAYNYHYLTSFDLIEKALRKLAGEELRNEIDVIKAGICPLPVSPPKARLYSPVVTYFIFSLSG